MPSPRRRSPNGAHDCRRQVSDCDCFMNHLASLCLTMRSATSPSSTRQRCCQECGDHDPDSRQADKKPRSGPRGTRGELPGGLARRAGRDAQPATTTIRALRAQRTRDRQSQMIGNACATSPTEAYQVRRTPTRAARSALALPEAQVVRVRGQTRLDHSFKNYHARSPLPRGANGTKLSLSRLSSCPNTIPNADSPAATKPCASRLDAGWRLARLSRHAVTEILEVSDSAGRAGAVGAQRKGRAGGRHRVPFAGARALAH